MSIIAVLFIGLIFVVVDALLIQETIDDIKTFKQDNWKDRTFKSIKFVLFVFLLLIQAWLVRYSQMNKQPETPRKEVVEYECPIVADTVKHDWVKNPDICIEKRLVYDQMLKDIER